MFLLISEPETEIIDLSRFLLSFSERTGVSFDWGEFRLMLSLCLRRLSRPSVVLTSGELGSPNTAGLAGVFNIGDNTDRSPAGREGDGCEGEAEKGSGCPFFRPLLRG